MTTYAPKDPLVQLLRTSYAHMGSEQQKALSEEEIATVLNYILDTASQKVRDFLDYQHWMTQCKEAYEVLLKGLPVAIKWFKKDIERVQGAFSNKKLAALYRTYALAFCIHNELIVYVQAQKMFTEDGKEQDIDDIDKNYYKDFIALHLGLQTQCTKKDVELSDAFIQAHAKAFIDDFIAQINEAFGDLDGITRVLDQCDQYLGLSSEEAFIARERLRLELLLFTKELLNKFFQDNPQLTQYIPMTSLPETENDAPQSDSAQSETASEQQA